MAVAAAAAIAAVEWSVNSAVQWWILPRTKTNGESDEIAALRCFYSVKSYPEGSRGHVSSPASPTASMAGTSAGDSARSARAAETTTIASSGFLSKRHKSGSLSEEVSAAGYTDGQSLSTGSPLLHPDQTEPNSGNCMLVSDSEKRNIRNNNNNNINSKHNN